MWESISFSSELSWIVDAMQRSSLFCCTDGSYMKKWAPAPKIQGVEWCGVSSHVEVCTSSDKTMISLCLRYFKRSRHGECRWKGRKIGW